MQHQILINVTIFVAYMLNLLLNTQRSHSRSQRAGKWSLILAHDRRPIYRAPTYIAVPLLGPHQPRYIGLTLYHALNRRAAGFQLEGSARQEAVITGALSEVFLPVLPSDGWRVLPADLQVYPPIWRGGRRLANTLFPG